MGEIVEIADHTPQSLARTMTELAATGDYVGGAFFLLHKNDTIHGESAAFQKKDLFWGLELAKLSVMQDGS